MLSYIFCPLFFHKIYPGKETCNTSSIVCAGFQPVRQILRHMLGDTV